MLYLLIIVLHVDIITKQKFSIHKYLLANHCILYCIVLKGWSLLPNALQPFQDLLCFPEFRYYQDVNMLIKFCSETYFFRLEVLRLGTPSIKSLREDFCSGFLRPEKIHRPQSSLNPGTLDLEASTLPRDHLARQKNIIIQIMVY